MPLSFNLRQLEEDEVCLQGELPVAELDFGVQDELIQFEKPLHYDLEVQQLHDSLLVTGSLQLVLNCECVRCLKPFAYKLEMSGWALHLPLEGEGFRQRTHSQFSINSSEPVTSRLSCNCWTSRS